MLANPRKRALDLLAGAVAAVCLGVLVARMRGGPPSDFDDAYTFIRYADNLRAGAGLAWNRGEAPVGGATSLLYVLVVAAVRTANAGLGGDDGRLLQAAATGSAVCALLVLAVAGSAAARARGLAGRPLRWLALISMTLATRGVFAFHCATGMDTMTAVLANALLAWSCVRVARGPSAARASLMGIAAYVSVLARPDNIVYAVGVPLGTLLVSSGSARLWVAFGVPFLAALGLDVTARTLALGAPVPLAWWAKRPGYYVDFLGERGWNPWWFLRVFVADLAAPLLVVVGALAPRERLRELAVWSVPVVLTVVALLWPRHIMGHLGRLFMPGLPFLVMAAACALDGFVLRVQEQRLPPWSALALRAGASVALVAITTAALQPVGAAWAGAQAPAAEVPVPATRSGRVLPELDSWEASQRMARLAAVLPPGTRAAMSEHGLVAARAPQLVIIDVLGLHDRGFARAGFSVAELWRRRPDLIWLPHPDHQGMLRQLLTSETLRARYWFVPDAFCYGLALDRASPRFAAIHQQVTAAFADAYPGLRIDDFVARWD